jgi:hypothetical protein
MNRNYSLTSALVFAIAALAHAWSFVLNVPAQMGAMSVPRPVTGLVALVAAILAVWGIRTARLGKSSTITYT